MSIVDAVIILILTFSVDIGAGALGRLGWDLRERDKRQRQVVLGEVAMVYGDEAVRLWDSGHPFVGMTRALLVASWRDGRTLSGAVYGTRYREALGFQWVAGQNSAHPKLGVHYELRVHLEEGVVIGYEHGGGFKRVRPQPLKSSIWPRACLAASVILALLTLPGALVFVLPGIFYPEIVAALKQLLSNQLAQHASPPGPGRPPWQAPPDPSIARHDVPPPPPPPDSPPR